MEFRRLRALNLQPIAVRTVSLGLVLGLCTVSMFLPAQQPAQPEKADSVLVLKKDHVLELLAAGKVIRTYKVALGQGGLAPKQREDDAGFPGRSRVHAGYSAQVKFYDKPKAFLDKIAWTLTGDAGCEYGGGAASGPYDPNGDSPLKGSCSLYSGGVNCHSSKDGKPKQMFVGAMSYLRFWFNKDLYAVTLGGGLMNNPGRYLTLLPPINGATASTGTPYFTENGGDRAQMHDGTVTFDYMPAQFITFRLEEAYRYSDVPYWTGRGGITSPGGNNNFPQYYACSSGASSGLAYGTPLSMVNQACGGAANSTTSIWWPDLRTNQTTTLMSGMVRF